jgi:hypothetical protein
MKGDKLCRAKNGCSDRRMLLFVKARGAQTQRKAFNKIYLILKACSYKKYLIVDALEISTLVQALALCRRAAYAAFARSVGIALTSSSRSACHVS